VHVPPCSPNQKQPPSKNEENENKNDVLNTRIPRFKCC
jgi:hypothetical protein